MAETASTLATWRVGGQIDESALTGISQFADIVVVATLVGASGQNAVDPTNGANVLRGGYTTIVGGIPGTATTKPSVDGDSTLAGRLWWTEPLKPTGAVDPNDALQPSGLAWQITVTANDRRGDTHQLATFTVGLEGDRDYTTVGETILVPSGTAGADQTAINVKFLTEPPFTIALNTFEGRVLDVIADNGITGTPELPLAGTTGQALVKASGTNYDVTWSTIVGGGGTLPPGYIDAGDFLDPAKAAFWTSGPVPPEGDSTADFQALFDYVYTLSSASGASARVNRGGVTILIPRGVYVIGGTVNIPSMQSGEFKMTVDAMNAQIYHRPPLNAGCSMFKTALATDANDAEVQNDLRNFWTWRGGYFAGRTYAGDTAFELNCVSRMVMERVTIAGFETGIRGRFVLHCMIRDSEFSGNSKYQIHIAASGGADAWTGATPGNAASNGTVIQNVRFYGAATEIAQVRIDHSSHTIRDCTFEGGGPENTADGGGYNIMFENQNTSVLTSTAENLWLECNPAVAHVYVNTYHQYDLDIQHKTGSVTNAHVVKSSLMMVRRAPWGGGYKLDTGDAIFGQRNINVRMVFMFTGQQGVFDMAADATWVNGTRPGAATAIGFEADGAAGIIQTFHYDKTLSRLETPNGFYNVGDFITAQWKVMDILT